MYNLLLENLSLLFDVFILVVLIYMWILIRKYEQKKPTSKIIEVFSYGVMLMGLSQFIQVFDLNVLQINIQLIETLHIFLLLLGLIFVLWGFNKLLNKK